ncbi:MAG: PepSY domain-containing protein, partial [Acinetobacter sp.]
MFKNILFQLHWFFGITAGLILSIMGVTGALYSYDQQILKWINPESYTVAAEQRPKLTPEQLFATFHQKQADIKINSITVTADPTEISIVNVAKEGARRGKNLPVNPYTAEVLPDVKGQEFFMFIMQLHRNLTAGEVGKQITGACTLMLIYFVLSGLYLRWPKKHTLKQWILLKPQLKGRNFIWDLHAVVGTWVLVFYLIFSITGLYWSYDWWRKGMFAVMGVESPMNRNGAAQGNRPQPNNAAQGQVPQGAATNRTERMQGEQSRNRRSTENSQGLNVQQSQQALALAWTVFNQSFHERYSQVTFSLPQAEDGNKMKIIFMDVQKQHERARNNAVYDIEKQKLEKIDLYQDKKLNEKIMGSMLPVHRGSFFGPTYQFIALLASLAMPLFFVTGWMLYLKRRKQKKLTQQARGNGTLAVTGDGETPQWLIIYATQTGTAEQLAWATAKSLQQAQQTVAVRPIHELTESDLKLQPQILFILSTYGTGEAPDLASRFSRTLMKTELDLSKLRYAVLALGSKEYPESYCEFGNMVDAWLKHNQASALFPLIEVDNAAEQDIQRWNDALASVTQLDLESVSIDREFHSWTLSNRYQLNQHSQGHQAFHIELTTDQDLSWKAGDIAEIQPANSVDRIQQFMLHHDIDADVVLDSGETIQHALKFKD